MEKQGHFSSQYIIFTPCLSVSNAVVALVNMKVMYKFCIPKKRNKGKGSHKKVIFLVV